MDTIKLHKECLAEDEAFKVGDPVTVFWSSCGRQFEAKAHIRNLNEKSLLCVLEEAVGTDFYGGYKVGQTINVPRLINFRAWSIGNCARARKPEGLATP